MPAKTLTEAFDRQPFARNRRVIRKKDPVHPAMKQAKASFESLHGKRNRKV